MKLRTLIVEDEPLSLHYLRSLLSRLPDIEIAGHAATEDEAVTAIPSLQPDLVFLDIELHSGTGFEVLRKTQHLRYSVVFTTALEQQAIKMIKLSGVPFLQKPIDADELAAMINCLSLHGKDDRTSLEYLLQAVEHDETPKYMSLHGDGARQYVELAEVLYITSGSPSSFFLREGQVKTDERSLKELESLLEDAHFFRSAASHLVNLKGVKDVVPGEDSIRLVDGSLVPLSPKKRDAFMAQWGRILE